MFSISITLVIIIITCIISITAFSNQKVINDLIFYPPAISEGKQWYRLFSHGLIHADFMHLAFNMYVLYGFGEGLEGFFASLFGVTAGKIFYILLYVLGLLFSSLPTYLKNKHNSGYSALGASGAVSSILFAYIILNPTAKLGMLFIPGLKIPAYIFGALYLGISYYMAKKAQDNIGHEAHYWGAVFGIVFVILTGYFIANYPVLSAFIYQIKG